MKSLRGLLAASTALALAFMAAPAGAFTITAIGTVNNNGSGLTITTTADAPPGSLLIIPVANTNAGTTPTVTDNAVTPNTYTNYKNASLGGGQPSMQVFKAEIATDLPLGGTITFTNLNFSGATAYLITGQATSTPMDGGVCSTIASPTTTLSSGSATPTVSGDLAMGFATAKFGGAMTQDGAYGTPPVFTVNCGGACTDIGGSKTISGTTSTAYAPSTATNGNGAISCVVFIKPTGAAPAVSQGHNGISLMGAGG